MNAVLRIDLKARTIYLFNHLIDTGWAVSLRWLVVFGQVRPNRDVWVGQAQMAGLILFVIGVCQKDAAKLVKTNHTIGLGIVGPFCGCLVL